MCIVSTLLRPGQLFINSSRLPRAGNETRKALGIDNSQHRVSSINLAFNRDKPAALGSPYEMAATRYTSTMLGRMAVASPTRAFSTAIPLRMAPSNGPSRPARSNPLVGNYVSAEPAQPREIESASSSSSGAPGSTLDADMFPPPPPPPSKSAGEATAEQQRPLFAYNAVDTRPLIDIANIISDKSVAYGRVYGISNPLDRPKVRAKAVAGRTVFIKDRLTPQSAPTPMVALRVLDKMCRDQKIKNKFHSQKFHERKGLKKKRLRSQRWRARFKTGFKAAVSRVVELKRQGW